MARYIALSIVMLLCFKLLLKEPAGFFREEERTLGGRTPAPASVIAFGMYEHIRQFGNPVMHPMHRVIVDLFSDTCQPNTSGS